MATTAPCRSKTSIVAKSARRSLLLSLCSIFGATLGDWKSHVTDQWWQAHFGQGDVEGLDSFFAADAVRAILHPDEEHWSALSYSAVEPIRGRDNREGWSTGILASDHSRRVDLTTRDALARFHEAGGVLRVENVERLPGMQGIRQAILATFGRKCVVGCLHLYYATAGKGSYGWHVDEVDVFVYGISGQKRLRVAGNAPR